MSAGRDRVTIPTEAPAGVLDFNAWVRAEMEALPSLWEVGAPVARQAREEGRSIFGELTRSPRAEIPFRVDKDAIVSKQRRPR